jgi:hypothetical protein
MDVELGTERDTVAPTTCLLARVIATGTIDEDALEPLLGTVRANGLRQVASSSVRLAARRALERVADLDANDAERDAMTWLLGRFAGAGALPPSYADYIAGDVTRRHLLTDGDTHRVLANVSRWAYDAFEVLRDQSVLAGFDECRRDVVENAAVGVQEVARATAFAARRPPANVEYELLARVLLVPESPYAEEMLFLRVLQAMELVFETVGQMLDASRRSFSHGDVATANLQVHGALLATDMLPPLMRAVRAIPVETWRSLRPFILEPGAVQGAGYPAMMLALESAVRVETLLAQVNDQTGLAALPRIAERDQVLLDAYRTLLGMVEKELRRWRSWHGRAAATYNGETSQWLDDRSAHAQHVRDAS